MLSALAEQYILGDLIGSGSYAEVWEARRPEDKSSAFAVKVFSSEKGVQHGRNEVEMMRRVSHPHALPVLDVSDKDDEMAVVTPFIQGGNLLDYLRKSSCLSEPTARALFLQVAACLHHTHSVGVVHRDIKLENILITKDAKNVYLADWGFAGEWQAGKLISQPYGSLHYCAPEIVRGAPYFGPEVDVWSLGVVLYALVAAKLPFRGESARKIHKRILIAEPTFPSHFSPSLVSLICSMLNPDRALRATMADVLASEWITEGDDAARLAAAAALRSAAPAVLAPEAKKKEQLEMEEAALRRNARCISPQPVHLS